MKNRITCSDCERCRQCFEEDIRGNEYQYIVERWEEFKSKTACAIYFKEKDEH